MSTMPNFCIGTPHSVPSVCMSGIGTPHSVPFDMLCGGCKCQNLVQLNQLLQWHCDMEKSLLLLQLDLGKKITSRDHHNHKFNDLLIIFIVKFYLALSIIHTVSNRGEFNQWKVSKCEGVGLIMDFMSENDFSTPLFDNKSPTGLDPRPYSGPIKYPNSKPTRPIQLGPLDSPNPQL